MNRPKLTVCRIDSVLRLLLSLPSERCGEGNYFYITEPEDLFSNSRPVIYIRTNTQLWSLVTRVSTLRNTPGSLCNPFTPAALHKGIKHHECSALLKRSNWVTDAQFVGFLMYEASAHQQEVYCSLHKHTDEQVKQATVRSLIDFCLRRSSSSPVCGKRVQAGFCILVMWSG